MAKKQLVKWSDAVVMGKHGNPIEALTWRARRLLHLRDHPAPLYIGNKFNLNVWSADDRALRPQDIDWTGCEEAARSKHTGGVNKGPSKSRARTVYFSDADYAWLKAQASSTRTSISAQIASLVQQARAGAPQ